ncbi:MAG: pitrilysin family protein [Kiloniellales bacterium]
MSVRVSRLDSGLTVASDTMDTVETVSLGAWVGVGTRHEPAEINGVAHLLEHMAFKGTERRSAYDIAEQIEAVGGHLNAYTSRESTAYYAKVLAEDAPLAVDIIADILQHPTFDEAELGRERAVVLQEIGQAFDTPDDIIFDRFQETAYPGQALGRPVLGTSEIVAGIGRDTLKAYMDRHYGAESMVLAAAGRIDHEAFLSLVSDAFDSLPGAGAGTPEPASYRGGDYREGRELEQVHLLLGFESIGYLDEDYYTASVLSTLFGGGMSSRLFQEVRERRGLVYSIYSFLSAYQDGGLFGIYAGTGEDEIEELIPVVCDELSKLSLGVLDQEVARARAQIKASILMGLENTGTRCEQLAQQILVYGRPLPVEEIVGRIEAVEAGGVRRMAERLASSRLTLASLGPVGRVEAFDRVAARFG